MRTHYLSHTGLIVFVFVSSVRARSVPVFGLEFVCMFKERDNLG